MFSLQKFQGSIMGQAYCSSTDSLLCVAYQDLGLFIFIGQKRFMQPWTEALPKGFFSGSVHIGADYTLMKTCSTMGIGTFLVTGQKPPGHATPRHLGVMSKYNSRGPLYAAASRHQLLLNGYIIHIWKCLIIIDN